jgi:hypothetical protein
MRTRGNVTPRWRQGCCLGDLILLSGAAVYLGKRLGGVRIMCSDYCLDSGRALFAKHPEVEACCGFNEASTNQSYPKLVDVNDSSAIVRSLEATPKLWYKQLSVPFNELWDSCPIPELVKEIAPSKESVVFIHDDHIRNQNINVDGYRPPLTSNILDHIPMIKAARAIHCINSCFFHLIEEIPAVAAELFYHAYVRKPYPDLPMRHAWNVLTEKP